MTSYISNQEWFKKHVTYWYDLSNKTEADGRQLNLTLDLPSFDPAFDGTLNHAVDKLNDAFNQITDNVISGAKAIRKMGDGLLETGKSYGLTEEQAADLAGKVHNGD